MNQTKTILSIRHVSRYTSCKQELTELTIITITAAT